MAKTYTCDICGATGEGGFSTLRIVNENLDVDRSDDICTDCFNRLRVYIRHGMPKISEIKNDSDSTNT